MPTLNPGAPGVKTLKDAMAGEENTAGQWVLARYPTLGEWKTNLKQTSIMVGMGDQRGSRNKNYPGDNPRGLVEVPGVLTHNFRYESGPALLQSIFGPPRQTGTSALTSTPRWVGPSIVYEGAGNPNGTNPAIAAHPGPPAGSFTGNTANATKYYFRVIARFVNGTVGNCAATGPGPELLFQWTASVITNGQLTLNVMRYPDALCYDVYMAQQVYSSGAYQDKTVYAYLGTVADPGVADTTGYVQFQALTPAVNPAVPDSDHPQTYADLWRGSPASVKATLFSGTFAGLSSPVSADSTLVPGSDAGITLDVDDNGATIPTRLILQIAGTFTADSGHYGNPFTNGGNTSGITVRGTDTNGTNTAYVSFAFTDTGTPTANAASSSFQQFSGFTLAQDGKSSTGYPLASISGIYLSGATNNWIWTGTPTITLYAECTSGTYWFVDLDDDDDIITQTLWAGDNVQFWRERYCFWKDVQFQATLDKPLVMTINTGAAAKDQVTKPGQIEPGQTIPTYPVVAKYLVTPVVVQTGRLYVDDRAIFGNDNYGTTQYQGVGKSHDFKRDSQRKPNFYLDNTNTFASVTVGDWANTMKLVFQWNSLARTEYDNWQNDIYRFSRIRYTGPTATPGSGTYPNAASATGTVKRTLIFDLPGKWITFDEGEDGNTLTRDMGFEPMVDPLFNAESRTKLVTGSTLG